MSSSGRIPQHFIDELVGRADIVDVIGSRVPLKKGGKEYKARCPFHDEKSASFTVVPDKQFYHCFGCGAHGTALGFLMDYDHLSFVEAVEELATRVGLEVPREQDPNFKPKPSDDLYAPVEQAARLYADHLNSSDRAIQYVKKRGLTKETAQRFAMGYAPDAWDFIGKQLGETEADARRLLQVGLVIEREQRGGYYDRFRDRIMFPIRDTRGRAIGFGGRILDQGEPKYLNSPETELFHKGKELYGLFEARQSTRSLQRLMVVEGYMDVVRLHQAGITYAVATLGTATTPEHLTRIFRVVSEVVFCFDGDRAGRAAAWRALENSLSQIREGRQIRFLFLPDGHDPDSLVGEEGREKFEARLDSALALSDYFIRELSTRSDVQTVDGRAQLAETARPLLAKIPPGVYRELLLDELGRTIGMSGERLAALFGSSPQVGARAANSSPDRAFESSNPDGNKASHSAGPSFNTGIGQGTGNPAGRRNLVRQAVHVLVHFPQAAQASVDLDALRSVDRPGVPLLVELLDSLRSNPSPSTGALLERWREKPDYPSLARLAALECIIPDAKGATRELADALQRLIEEEGPKRRTDELLNKAKRTPLTDEEGQELQSLLTMKGSRAANRNDRKP
jgi:DNA primase